MQEALVVKAATRTVWTGDLLVTPRLDSHPQEQVLGIPHENGEVSVGQQTAPPLHAVVWLGPPEKLSAETLRRAGSGLARWLAKKKIAGAALDPQVLETLTLPGGSQPLEAFLEGLLLGAFRFDDYKTQKDGGRPIEVSVLVSGEASEYQSRVETVRSLVRGVNLARAWAHEPPNVLNPATLADRAQILADSLGMKCTVLDHQQLVEMGAGAITGVGQGSRAGSRMIVLEYPGAAEPAGAQPVVLVGKAITFDTGGYSLKERAGMVGMKYDKCGGMAVLGIFQAAAELKLKTPLVGIVAAAENMVSADAYRPNDILTTLSGKTIEVISADAEGRLVLCDALTYAQRQYQPRALIDIATLTGGVVIALGKLRAGLMSNNDDLSRALVESGEAVHERLWRLPLDDEYFEGIQGDDSDFKNSGARDAHAIIGGIFLKQFIENDLPWAHLDIAGTARTDKEMPYSPVGATGFGVRLIVHYLQQMEKQGM